MRLWAGNLPRCPLKPGLASVSASRSMPVMHALMTRMWQTSLHSVVPGNAPSHETCCSRLFKVLQTRHRMVA